MCLLVNEAARRFKGEDMLMLMMPARLGCRESKMAGPSQMERSAARRVCNWSR